MPAYPISDAWCDVLVVGGGGAGLRAAIGMAQAGLDVACVSKLHPLRSPTVQAQGGIAAPLGNMGEDHWRWHMYDTIKGSDWLGDQDAIAVLCRNANRAIVELEHFGVPFSRNAEGRIYQRPYGGHSQNFGQGPAARACAVADRTGHAILHALYGQALRHGVTFFDDHFALDLLCGDDGAVRGVLAWDLKAGALRRFTAPLTVLATGGSGRVFFACTSGHTATGDGGGMALRAGLALQDMEFVQFHPTGIYPAGCLVSEACRAEGGHLSNGLGERFMAAYAPQANDLASRDVVARAMTLEILAGRGAGPEKDHILLHVDHLDPVLVAERLPRVLETARQFAGIDARVQPIPVLPTVHYTMGGIPANIHCEVIDPAAGGEAVVPGLMAVGEAACLSVHGANRLGCNSLLDLIVFGRLAAERAVALLGRTATKRRDPAPADSALARFDALRHARGEARVGAVRLALQKTMQHHCGVFRTGDLLAAGQDKLAALAAGLGEVGLQDRSLRFNTELVERLELDNLMGQALLTLGGAAARTESRGAHSRDDWPERDDIHWLCHSLGWVGPDWRVRLGRRAVRLTTGDAEMPSVSPAPRSY